MGRKVQNTITITAVINRDEQGILTISGHGIAEANFDGQLSPDETDEEFVIRGRLGRRIGATQYTLTVTGVEPAIESVLSTAELAERLGIKPGSVRQRMRRWGIEHVEGWPTARVLPILRGRQPNAG